MYQQNECAARASKRRARVLLGLFAPLLATTALTPAAWAQTTGAAGSGAAAGSSNAVGEIIVTAQRREQSIMSVPMSLQVVTGRRLVQMHLTDVQSLTMVAPTFTVSKSYQGTPNYSIRGIGFNAVNISSTPTVTLYQDDVAFPYPFTQIGPVYDIDDLEVLKGPQGTLYGRNTTAGVLNVTTNAPTKTFEASAAAEVGNYSTYNFEGVVSGPLADNVQARLAFRTEDSGQGWQVDNTTGARLGQVHNYGARLRIAAEPTPRLKVDVSLSGWWDRSDSQAGQGFELSEGVRPPSVSNQAQVNDPRLQAYFNQYPLTSASQAGWEPGGARAATIGAEPGAGVGIGGPLRDNSYFLSGGLKIGYDLTDKLHLESVTGLQYLNRNSLQDESGVPEEILIQHPTGNIKSYSEELHLSGENGTVKWMVGGYYAQDTIHEDIRSLIGDNANSLAIQNYMSVASILLQYTLPPAPSAAYVNYFNTIPAGAFSGIGGNGGAFRTFVDEGSIRTETQSLLANASWTINPKLTLDIGGRYTGDDLSYSGCTRDYNGNTIEGVNTSVALLTLLQGATVPANPAQPGQCVTYNALTATRGMVNNTLDEQNFAYHAALSWRPIDHVMAYVSAAQGAKSGVNPINTANATVQEAPVKQEILKDYEVGVRTNFDRLRFSAGGFYYDYTDKQISAYYNDIVFGALARLVNIPKSVAYGAETELNYRIWNGFSFTGTATYLETSIGNYTGINGTGGVENFKGRPFPYAPHWETNAALNYDKQLNERLGLRAMVDYRFQSKSTASVTPTPDYVIHPYGILDANLTLYDAVAEKWAISFWGRNITNTYYPTSINDNSNVIFKLAGMPVTYGATVRRNF